MPRTLLLALALWLSAGPAPAHEPVTARFVVKSIKGPPIADAVVALVPLDPAAAPPAGPSARVEVVQEDEQYQPYLTIVRTGTQVDFPNKDRIQHHLYSVSPAKKFEKPLYAPGAQETVHFDQPGVVTLGCNIHDWMVAYIVVVDTPWFARTGPGGHAAITAPPGRYRVEVWHPRLVDERNRQRTTPLARELTLAGGTADEEFALPLAPERRLRRAPADRSSRY